MCDVVEIISGRNNFNTKLAGATTPLSDNSPTVYTCPFSVYS